VSVGKQHKVVVDGENLNVVASLLESLRKSLVVQLIDYIASEINFANCTSGSSNVVQHQEHVSVRQKLYRLRNAERKIVIVIPDHVA
jgi:predicted aldo/keto reductase-like oxidoreductase